MEAFQWIVSEGRFYDGHAAAARAWEQFGNSVGAKLVGVCSAYHVETRLGWRDVAGNSWVLEGVRRLENVQTGIPMRSPHFEETTLRLSLVNGNLTTFRLKRHSNLRAIFGWKRVAANSTLAVRSKHIHYLQSSPNRLLALGTLAKLGLHDCTVKSEKVAHIRLRAFPKTTASLESIVESAQMMFCG